MEIYTLTVICSIGIAGIASFLALFDEHDHGNYNPYVGTHAIGGLIGLFLAIAVLIYTFINFKWWYIVTVLIVAAILAKISILILNMIFGRVLTRLLLIWLCPLVGSIYFIVKAI